MTPGTILLPIAGRSSRFPGMRPKWMLSAPTGELMLEKAVRSIPNYAEHRIVIGALSEHLHDLRGAEAIDRSLGSNVEVIEFSETTSGPAATISQMIERAEVRGPIFIKDCDSWFNTSEPLFENVISLVDLKDAPNTRNIPGKSFVILNENMIVEEIREKIVCSPYISVGGYGFDDAVEFLQNYERVSRDKTDSEPFVSHVILEAIRHGSVFKGIAVNGYYDVGTLEAWNEFRENHNLYICDIDGVVFRNAGQYTKPLWDDEDIPLEENINLLKRLLARGGQIVFVTSRPERYRQKTEDSLKKAGLAWHSAIFGVSHSRRVLINDYAPSNPYPSALAVNVGRNSDDLKRFIDK